MFPSGRSNSFRRAKMFPFANKSRSHEGFRGQKSSNTILLLEQPQNRHQPSKTFLIFFCGLEANDGVDDHSWVNRRQPIYDWDYHGVLFTVVAGETTKVKQFRLHFIPSLKCNFGSLIALSCSWRMRSPPKATEKENRTWAPASSQVEGFSNSFT